MNFADDMIERAVMLLLVVAQSDELLAHEAIEADYAMHGVVNIPRVTAAIERLLATVH